MTVSTQVSRNEYTGNGATTQYDFTFRILDKSHLLVQRLDTVENITTLALGTDYSVTGVNRYNGGKVVLTSALPVGYKISIERRTPLTQETSIRNQGGFFPEIHEDAFDKLTMLIQQVYGWWSGLALKKPSWLANYYDALGNRIRNLRDPSQAQDAATKGYADSLYEGAISHSDNNFKRTLRVPESEVGMLPGISGRRKKILAFNDQGSPIAVLPESGSAADVMVELAASDGQLLIGSPRHIEDLRCIFPGARGRIKTLGALTAYDGGGDTWVFDPSDMSSLVSLYPKVFIAPTADPTGVSGAWKLAWNMKGINASAYGIGCQAGNYAHDTAALQQLGDWNRAVQWINLPSEMYIIELNYAENPKFYGIAGANSDLSDTRGMGSREHGSVIYARDSDSSNPVIHIHGNQGTDRLGGVDLCFISLVSVDLIENRNLTIRAELNQRSTRPGILIEYVASKTNIQGLGIFGFKKCLYCNEVWDGSIRDLAINIGSDEDGTVPAVYFGSYGSDNTNNLTIDTFRIEHCPYSLEVDFVDHVRFVNGKIETYRKPDATHHVVKVGSKAERYLFSGVMFVNTPTTETPYLYEQGKQGTYSSCWMTAGGITGNYPGVRWIYRDPTGTSVVKFMGMTINGPMQADGTDPTAYPIYLASYDEFGGTINCYDSFTVNGSVVNPSYQGLICMNTGTKMGKLHINTNNITKTAGTVFYARGGEYDIGKPTLSGAPHSLLAGNKNDIRIIITTASDIEIYRRETVVLNTGTTLNSMKGFVGQVIRVMTFGTGCTITHSSLINNSSGANISMTANTVYTFMMLTGMVAKQI